MPRSPRDSGKNARPRASKTVLGTRATLYVPRTVLEALGRHFFPNHSENRGILSHITLTSEMKGERASVLLCHFDIQPEGETITLSMFYKRRLVISVKIYLLLLKSD